MKRVLFAVVAAMSAVAPCSVAAQQRGANAPASARNTAPTERLRVLWVAAHPDDEDTQLLTWLSRSGRAEAAYLSLTRGDGGQNLIGNELGEQLGIIRTEELLAARRVDGARQYFTRAYDFGFSKTAAETYNHWPKDSVLGDVVTVVRAFRPHIIMTTFSGTPTDGHGQHQVSAFLAKEAYNSAAADTVRFPARTFGAPWTPLKFYRFARFSPEGTTIRVNVGEYNARLGKSYAEIAAESRSQHKSQGFGTLVRKGVVWDLLRRDATRVNANTAPKDERSIFDGLESVARTTAATVDERLAEPNVTVEAVSDRRVVATGDSARVTVSVFNRSPVRITARPGWPGAAAGSVVAILPDSSYKWTMYVRGSQITQPWWLATPRNGDLFSPEIGPLSEDERQKQSWLSVAVCASDASCVTHRTAVVYHFVDLVQGDIQRPIAVVPPISITLEHPLELARAGIPFDRFLTVTVRSALTSRKSVVVSLSLPSGLTADSAQRTITVDSAGTRAVTFRVRGRLPAGTHTIAASAATDGITSRIGYIPIDYEHITPERQYRDATLAIRTVDVAVPPGLRVAYIAGVGDNVAPALRQLGIPVTMVLPSEIPATDLSSFTTVVVGPRAYQAMRELIDNNEYLLSYARNGGTLVVQYGQYEMTRPGVMPYPITISRPHDRVAEENAAVTVLEPSSRAFSSPNRITSADYEGWVQERALYMPRTFDPAYRPLLSMSDSGEQPNRGAILVTPYGKGMYVYTTLAFFRQLPAGVSGATRLFVNLLSLKGDGR
ncbi:MAG TPA: PIG-L family deacetylase [Gemmatimonadaceae bacterium]|nr:PIG-L family deacetylase [Gemmatimonadaceae bacterium]